MKSRNGPFHGASGYSGLRARNLTFKKIVKEVMRGRSNDRFIAQMENMMRRIIQEEFDRRIQPYLASTSATIRSETPLSRLQFMLRFINSPRSSIFTGSNFKAEDGSLVAIELVYANTNARVVSGPLSSSRVDIVPLNADFTEENWNVEGFKRNILKEREGKRPLLTGDLTVTLRNGLGVIAGDVCFTDNSSWTRSKKFRLGAKLARGEAVEARSEAFGCKDQRGVSYEKHHPPYPGDDLWRLEKIADVTATRLAARGIKTVKDFRIMYAMDPTLLYNIIGISKRTWNAIVSHAMDCVLDETECYIYNTNTPGVTLLLNSLYDVIKVSFNGIAGPFVDHIAVDKPFLDKLKVEAHQNHNLFTKVDGRIFVDQHPQRSLPCPQNPGFGIPCPGLEHIGSSGASNSSMSLYLPQASVATAQPEMLMSLENIPTATFHIDEKFLPRTLRNSFRVRELDQVHGELSQSQAMVTSDNYVDNEEDENVFSDHPYQNIPLDWSPGMTQWSEQAFEDFRISVSGTDEAGMYDVHIGSPRGRWCKVKAALKIREVWRQTTARNRNRNRNRNRGL